MIIASAAAMAQQPVGATGQGRLRRFGAIPNTIVMAIGVIVGLVEAIGVYSKWHNGDPDTMKAVTGWFGASQFLVDKGALSRSKINGFYEFCDAWDGFRACLKDNKYKEQYFDVEPFLLMMKPFYQGGKYD